MATWEQVRRYALALPGVTETTSRGNAAWLVGKHFFLWERPLRKADLEALGDAAPAGPVLALRTANLEMKDAILRSEADVAFTTPHFDGYPTVLVRLGAVSAARVKTLIAEAWLARAPERAARAYLADRARRDGSA